MIQGHSTEIEPALSVKLCLLNVFTWRHHFLKSKPKEPPKFYPHQA